MIPTEYEWSKYRRSKKIMADQINQNKMHQQQKYKQYLQNKPFESTMTNFSTNMPCYNIYYVIVFSIGVFGIIISIVLMNL